MSIEISELRKVNLAKGDILLVSVDNLTLNKQQKTNIGLSLKEIFTDNEILVIGAGFSLGVITKKDIENL